MEEELCKFESDGLYHSCIKGCEGLVENCRKCKKDRCSNRLCPLGKGIDSGWEAWEYTFYNQWPDVYYKQKETQGVTGLGSWVKEFIKNILKQKAQEKEAMKQRIINYLETMKDPREEPRINEMVEAMKWYVASLGNNPFDD